LLKRYERGQSMSPRELGEWEPDR